MLSKFALFGLSVVGGAVASPIESYVYNDDQYQGFRLPMNKKDIGIPLHKRANGVAVNNRYVQLSFAERLV